jgi:hypothetical protein
MNREEEGYGPGVDARTAGCELGENSQRSDYIGTLKDGQALTPNTNAVRFLICLAVVLASCGAPASDSHREPAATDVNPTLTFNSPAPTLDREEPVVIGDGPNTDRPSGDDRTGLDATDDICDEMKRDLEEAITATLQDLRDAGVSSDFLPSRADLKRELGGALRANGCSASESGQQICSQSGTSHS